MSGKFRYGNVEKAKAYALAIDRMNSAIEGGFFLEAVTIQESILADRIWAALNANKHIVTKKSNVNPTLKPLGSALREWCNLAAKGFDSTLKDIPVARLMLDSWWSKRNALLHGVVKSLQGNAPSITADEFVNEAKLAAEIGKSYVADIMKWSKSKVRKHRAWAVLSFGNEMSCRIIGKAFDVIRVARSGKRKREIVNEILKEAWADKLKRNQKLLKQFDTRVGWCLNQLQTAGLVSCVNRNWVPTDYGLTQVNGIYAQEVRDTVASIEKSI